MASTAPISNFRTLVEERFSSLASDLEKALEAEIASRISNAAAGVRDAARRDVAERLNQAVRRLRQARGLEQVCATLVDASAAFSKCAVVFEVRDGMASGRRGRGIAHDVTALNIPITKAAAFASAIETYDPVVCLSTGGELSPDFMDFLGLHAGERAVVFPVMMREKAAGLLYASGEVEMASLELLVQSAGAALEAQAQPEPAKAGGLIAIQPAQRRIPDSWSDLTPEDREIHLRAQRFARVQVAGMRLSAAESVQSGLAGKDLYSALQNEIDSGREAFRKTFLSETTSMVDYFHLELIRNLANDDPGLLGENYPGPLQ